MRFNRLVPIAVGVAVLIGIGGVAAASIPGTGGVLTGCVQKSSGQVRIIDTAKTSCSTTEQTVTWNQQGQPGTNGTNGAPGTNGTNGTDGVSGFSTAFASADWAASAHPPTNTVDVVVQCPPGAKVLGAFSKVLLLGFSGSGPLGPQSWSVETVGQVQQVHFVFMDPVTRFNFNPGQQLDGEGVLQVH
jgi:hypothetical protein